MGYQALIQASACVNFIHRPSDSAHRPDSSLEKETRDSPSESQRAEPSGRDREKMLRKCWDDGNVDAFPPNSLPRRALRGISMFYSWHRPVAGFLRNQWFLPGLRVYRLVGEGRARWWVSRSGIRGLPPAHLALRAHSP